jgi:teichuronic acid biosynthesis glycosyltransferase TuaG
MDADSPGSSSAHDNAEGLVSVVVPTYNSERFIRRALESVLTQQYSSIEVMVADDASTDLTVSIVEEMQADDSRIILLKSRENRGAAFSRNRAIAASRGKYIAFLDADDWWAPNKLRDQIEFMNRLGAAFSFTAYRIASEDGRDLNRTVDTHSPQSVDYEAMLKKRATLGCSTVIINRSCIPNLQMPSLRTGQDYALWLSILRQGWRAYCLRAPLTTYRLVAGSISRNKFRKALRQWEIYRRHERIPLLRSAWYFLHYAFRAIFRG